MSLLTVEHLKKVYTTRFGGNSVEALRDVNFTVEKGEYTAIMGESGSGKTTLLNILAALDKPTSGTVLLEGKNLANIKEKDIAAFRRDNLGFVFQEFNLLDTFNLEDNIYLPMVLAGVPYPQMKEQSGMMLLIALTRSKYHSRVYLRFISSNMRLLPLCTGRCI